MTSSTPPPLPPTPPSPPFAAARRVRARRTRISPRTVILSIVLAGSIIFFFLILFVALFAVLQEAAPRIGPHTTLIVAVKHVIARQIAHFIHHR
jgi:hypothetical protein